MGSHSAGSLLFALLVWKAAGLTDVDRFNA